MDVSEVLARRIREVRTRKGWSQRDLAAELDKAGLTLDPASVARIETNKRQVKASELVTIAAVLGVSPIHLMLPQTGRTTVRLADTVEVSTHEARQWFRGFAPLPGQSDETMAVERGDDVDLPTFLLRGWDDVSNWRDLVLDDMARKAKEGDDDA